MSVLLTDDGQITELNRQYRGQDRPTDVLSFSQLEGEGAAPPGSTQVLGDVVISVDRARAQALEAGIGLEEELMRLLAHGVLHLLGHDHEGSASEARAMRREEEKYFVRRAKGKGRSVREGTES